MPSTCPSAYAIDERPACINFSGGRSSGYMLYHLLEHHDGRLPPDSEIIFCNTGKERPETLDFVRRCSEEWNVPITWLEYRYYPQASGGRDSPKHHLAIVNHLTASRDGRPFDELIRSKKMLPNITMRFCSSQLKVNTTERYLRRFRGWDTFTNYLGIRFDEPRRIKRTLMEACKVDYPLYHAQVRRRQIDDFWRQHSFDLEIESREGNCDLCFLKGQAKLLQLIHEHPEHADWWIAKENQVKKIAGRRNVTSTQALFSKRHSYEQLKRESDHLTLPLPFDDDEAPDCFCGD